MQRLSFSQPNVSLVLGGFVCLCLIGRAQRGRGERGGELEAQAFPSSVGEHRNVFSRGGGGVLLEGFRGSTVRSDGFLVYFCF